MTQLEVKNNMAYSSQMQFEVLRRALWVWFKVPGESCSRSQDVRILTSCCEGEDVWNYPFVNTVGPQYTAAPLFAHKDIQSIPHSAPFMAKSMVSQRITAQLPNHWWQKLQDSGALSSSAPIPSPQTCSKRSILVIRSLCPQNRTNLKVTRGDEPAFPPIKRFKLQKLNPDVIVECYLDAKHYPYDPVELIDLADIHANFVNLVNDANVATVAEIILDEYNACPSLNENSNRLDNACPSWQKM